MRCFRQQRTGHEVYSTNDKWLMIRFVIWREIDPLSANLRIILADTYMVLEAVERIESGHALPGRGGWGSSMLSLKLLKGSPNWKACTVEFRAQILEY